MDPITGAVVIAGLGTVGKPAAELVKDLVERFLGPAVDAKGQALKEWLESRNERAANTLLGASEMLHVAGIAPQPVPGRILFPLLQSAALEENEALARQWAALLANAATPGFTHILPAYAEILRQLTPAQAQILLWMYQKGHQAQKQYAMPSSYYPDYTRYDLEAAHSLSPADYALLITGMERLQLIEPRRVFESSEEGWDGEEMFRAIIARWNSRVKYDLISFTTLGLRFMEACTPPKKKKRKH